MPINCDYCGYVSICDTLNIEPLLHSSNRSKSPILGWTPTSDDSNSNFFTNMEKLTCPKCGSMGVSRPMHIIQRCTRLPKSSSKKEYKTVISVLTLLIARCNTKSILRFKYDIFGPYNYCLQQLDMNMFTSPVYPTVNNLLINKGLEYLVWSSL